MNWFQILSLLCLGALTALSVAAWGLGKATRREAALWIALWICAAAAILKPDITMTVARKLGIGRGADLLLYCSVGVMMVGFLMVYIRLGRLRREITLIVRHLALKESQEGSNPEKQKT